MAFDTQVTSAKQAGARKMGVHMSSSLVGGKYSSPQVILCQDVCQKLGVDEGDVVRLSLGGHQDFGWARIERGCPGADPHDTLFILRQRNSGGSQMRISVSQLGDGSKYPTRACAYRLKDGGVEFQLPEWANVTPKTMQVA
jgi:hypothetical protein